MPANQGGTTTTAQTPMHGVLSETSSAAPLSQWIGMAVGMLGLIYLTFIRPLQKKKSQDPLAQQPLKSSLAQQRAVERDMSALLVEYEQMIRQMTAQIETRVTKLELLIGDADRKLAELRLATATASGTSAAPMAALVSLTSPPKIARTSALEPSKVLTTALSTPRLAELENASVTDASVTPVNSRRGAANLRASGENETQAGDESAAPLMNDIYALADQGLSVGEIARRSGRMYGEVELILALRSQREESGGAAEPHVSKDRRVEPKPYTSSGT